MCGGGLVIVFSYLAQRAFSTFPRSAWEREKRRAKPPALPAGCAHSQAGAWEPALKINFFNHSFLYHNLSTPIDFTRDWVFCGAVIIPIFSIA